MIHNVDVFMSPHQCPFAYRGQNLADIRRAGLRKILKEYGQEADPNARKQDLLKRLIILCSSDDIELHPNGLHERIRGEKK